MAERDYLDEEDWLRDGGLEGTGQPFVSPTPTGPPQSGRRYAWWSDPDTDPPSWMTNPGTPPIGAGTGYYWNWAGDHWQALPSQRDPRELGPQKGPTQIDNWAPPDGGYGGGGFGGGGGTGSFTSNTSWPSYDMPSYLDPGEFDPGEPFSYPEFSYKDFSAPTADSMLQEPGFQFRMDQGRKALEASAAGKGTLRSGGTLRDILQYGQNFASQEYGNVWNRALQEYDTNRNNAFGSWDANRDNAWDSWTSQYTGNKDAYAFKADNVGRQNVFNQGNSQFDFNAKQRQAEADLDEAFRRWQTEGGWIVDSGRD